VPEWKQEIRKRLAGLELEPTREAEIVEELAQHLDDRYEELLAGGATDGEAARAAFAELNETDLLERELRRVEIRVEREPIALGSNGRSNMLGDFWQDLSYAVRALRKNPVFTVVVILTLALGIGVNATFLTLFSLAFHPLPVNDPAAVVNLEYRGALDRDGYSFPEYAYFRDHTQVFSGLTAHSLAYTLVLEAQAASGESEEVEGQFVSENFFSVLGTNAVLGRAFTPGENRTPDKDSVVVLSYPFWQRHFSADRDVIGRTLRLNGKPVVIIGVAAPDFVGMGLEKLRVPDIWLPLMMRAELPPRDEDWFGSRWLGWLIVSGRLKPGRALEEASAEMSLFANQLARAYPELDPQASAIVRPISMLGHIPRDAWTIMSVVMIATAMVLLIACSNIANLLLSRAASRRKEIGVRLCLGASRGRVIRQLLTESFLLATLGGVAGLLMAWWSLRAFLASSLLSGMPKISVGTLTLFLNPNLRVLSCTFALSLLAGLACGLLPALRVTRGDLAPVLKDEAAAFGHRLARSRLGAGLVVAQAALSVVLLIAAGLLLRGVMRAGTINPGFEAKNILRVEPRFSAAGYDRTQTQRFREELRARLETLTGVQSVSQSLSVPLGAHTTTITLPGASRSVAAFYNVITPNYFDTLSIPLVRGRGFTWEEARAGAAVVVVSETTALKLWPGQEPLGQLLQPEPNAAFAQVIGVARDVQTVRLGQIDSHFVYATLTPRRRASQILVRTSRDPKETQALIRLTAHDMAPTVFLRLSILADDIAGFEQVTVARTASLLATGLGLLALLLAAVGLYGVMAYSVSQRTREIGIRVALGARRQDVLWLVLRQGMRMIGIGIVIGVAGGAAVSHALSAMLFGLSPLDPIAYLSVSMFLSAVALLACYFPARRAASVDPMTALRQE
jgi:macrolide transport system ATP-binding/permease protein